MGKRSERYVYCCEKSSRWKELSKVLFYGTVVVFADEVYEHNAEWLDDKFAGIPVLGPVFGAYKAVLEAGAQAVTQNPAAAMAGLAVGSAATAAYILQRKRAGGDRG